MMRRFETGFVVFLTALAIAGCGSSGQAPPHVQGAESFQSPPPGSSSGRATDTAGTTDPATSGAPGASPGGDAAAPRAIEEADVYKRVGSTLYVLNAYRGLQIVDLTDLAAPRLLSRAPVTGTPVDLYVRGATAFVVVSDYFTYRPVEDGSTRPDIGSRLFAIDVSDPAHPAILAEYPITGQVEQSRIVGDVLYVVSRNYGWYVWNDGAQGGVAAGSAATATSAPDSTSVATSAPDSVSVASFEITDPAHPRPIADLELPASGWDAHANVTSERITLSFAGWENDGQGSYGPVTRFQIVDISDPAGALKQGAAFSTSGTVQDRWGMDFDAAAGIFRAVVATGWSGGAALQTWSSPTPGAAAPLARLAVTMPESLTAARFDGPRVYMVTAHRTDPLWAIDASDPTKPVLTGSLEMPGQLDFIEPRGDRLVALGHTGEAGQPFQLAVSLLDVSDLSNPGLRTRVVFGGSWGSVGAQPDDLRKAFIVLDPPPAGIGLILVPVQGWDPATYAFAGGTQLVDFAHDALTLRGFVAHPGAVKRAFPADESGTQLVALSDSALQTIDATDRGDPRKRAEIDLARSVTTLALVKGKAVELCGDWYRGDMELAVTDALDPDAASPLARVNVPAPSARMFQDGDVAWLMAHDWTADKAWLQAVDFADPVNPVLRGRLDLAPEDAVGVYPGGWGSGDEAVLVGHALAVHRGFYRMLLPCPAGGSCGQASSDDVRVFDLSDADHPRLAATVQLADSSWSWGLQGFGSFLWLTHFEWQEGATTGRYYVDRIDLSDPSDPRILGKVNVPGVLFAASDDGRRLYTLETFWKESDATTWMHALELTPSGTARLGGSAPLEGYPGGAATTGGFAWAVTSRWSSDRTTTQLSAVDVGSMTVTTRQAVEGDWTWLRRAAGGKLFLQQSWRDQGILVYGLRDPARPAFERFVRTQGWVLDVVVGGGYAYLPSGPYGVPLVELAAQ